ncbi:AEL_collapsed_G0000900.mRNA.1.CDS.1 [Saccharomyces cerevisiae]|nr:AEL_HP1_G0000850.mRNA.1.CDS.1 [Saccharomyces cerevisiae]CAI6473751.1 AEL_collapsed_G0000900.mRNA.1.CDS.1 [Saccharomyces cerevisiae]
MPYNYLFLALFTYLATSNVVSGSTQACLPVGPRKNGMNVNFYKYSLLDSTTYSYPQYMTSGYASNWN